MNRVEINPNPSYSLKMRIFLARDGRMKLFESEWFGIDFKEAGLQPTPTKLADSKFYDGFYNRFFSKFPNYDALPADYRKSKLEVGRLILEDVAPKAKVLSVGCGNGIIESTLASRYAIDVFDFSTTSLRWLQNQSSLRIFTNEKTIADSYDLIYLVQVVYTLNTNELCDLGRFASAHLAPGGEFCITFTPYNSSPLKGVLRKLKASVRSVLIHTLWKDRFQFWGWNRSESYYRNFYESLGFKQSKRKQRGDEVILFFTEHSCSPTRSTL